MTTLCPSCASIPFDKILSRRRAKWVPIKIKRVTTSSLDKFTDCSLCKALQDITPPPLKELGFSPRKVLCLYAFEPGYLSSSSNIADLQRAHPDARRFFGVVWSDVDSTDDLSAVERSAMKASLNRSGYIWLKKDPQPRSDPLLGACVVDPASVDWTLVRRWFNNCKDHCSPLCNKDQAGKNGPAYLIDCLRKTVVQSPKHCDFLALSYVWGPPLQSTPGQAIGDRLEGLPQVIDDAIKVTISLGFSHLWVDRLCIPSSNPEQLHVELRNMSHIYDAAEITIIAAAGSSAGDGLPGLGSVDRFPQPIIEIGGHSLVSTMQYPRRLIDESTWKKRAWTYQEVQSSRRKLYFTSQQIYAECDKTCAWESAGLFEGRHYQISNRIYTPRDPFEAKGQSWNHIVEVSRRNLTFNHDNLNAVLGLLERQKIRAPTIPLTHLHGIPFYSISEGRPSQSLAIEICWGASQSPDRVRNTQYPSWSWAGWSRTSQGISRPAYARPKVGLGIKAEIPGRTEPWNIDNLVVRGSKLFNNASQLALNTTVLRITTNILDVRFQIPDFSGSISQGDIKHSDIIEFADRYYCTAIFLPTVSAARQAELRVQHSSGGLLVLSMDERELRPPAGKGRNWKPDRASMLIVAPVPGETNLWERVGTIEPPQSIRYRAEHLADDASPWASDSPWDDAPWQWRTIRLG